ncbi:MAG: HAD superfamily hydrolase (TIGR01509 family) [Glaciecola sp.]
MKGIIFDLDDTLVKTNLDFGAIKHDIACPSNEDILTFIGNIACPSMKSRAHNTVLEHELHDALTSTWLPGAQEFVQAAIQQDLPLAIVTRNCREATNIKIKNNEISIKQVITREDAPAKPDPTALLKIAAQWDIDVKHIAYVGDYIYDIQAAHNAEMQAWLYKYQAEKKDYKDCLSYIAKN